MRHGRDVRQRRQPSAVRYLGAVIGAAACTVLVSAQQPTFRSSVDLVAVDVQVVDKDGRPINSLRPGDFEVQIAGKKRRVVSADFIQSASVDTASGGAGIEKWRPQDLDVQSGTPGASRTFVLAFDTDSFTVGDLTMISVLRGLHNSGLLDEFPNLAAYVARGEARPAYKKAMADHLAATDEAVFA